MYKVFIYNKPIFFIDKKSEMDRIHGIPIEKCVSGKDKDKLLHRLKKKPQSLCIVGDSDKNTFKQFFSNHRIVEAAGGLVLNQKKQILFILRNGFWDLPKGKIEKNEKKKIAAVREVEEECGLINPVIQGKLLTTYHTYELKDKNILKPTYWYLMNYEGEEELVPQVEEGITEVKWVEVDQMEEQMSNTYDSIRDVVDEYLKR